MRKRLSLFVVVLLVIAIVTSCNAGTVTTGSTTAGTTGTTATGGSTTAAPSSNMTGKGELPIVKEKVTYKIMAPQTSYILDLNTNDYTVWLEEQTNVHMEYELVPENAMREKVSLTLASQVLPDAFMSCGISPADQVLYGTQGVFVPQNKFFDDYGVEILKAYDANAVLPEAITAPDGNIYAIAGINECYHCFYSGRAWINQKWLDNLGLKYPTTTDELYTVLKAFKTQDANGNGDPDDEIPMMGADNGWQTRVYEYLLQSFIYNDYGDRLAVTNGKIEFTATSPAFKEGLKYIKKLLDEGLIDPVSLTQTQEQAVVVARDPENITVGVAIGALWWSLMGEDVADPLKRSREYVGLSPVKGPDGNRYALTAEGGVVTGQWVITNVAKNPEVLFRWGDFQFGDMPTLYSSWGPKEGVGRKVPPEGTLGINGKPALYEVIVWTDTANIQNYHMTNIAIANRTSDFRLGQAVPDDPETKWDVEVRLQAETRDNFAPYRSDMALPALMMDADSSAKRATLGTPIRDYALESIVAFLAGNLDLEADWDTYVKEYEALKLEEYLQLLQTAYDAQYGK